MKKFKLVTFRDHPTGTLGLGLEGQQYNDDMFAALEGALVAHDIVEHPDTHNIDSVESELMALGAVWECRGRWGDFNRKGIGAMRSPEEIIASDYLETFRYFLGRDGGYITKPKLTRASHLTSDFDDALPHIMEEFMRLLRSEDMDADDEELQKFKQAALHYGRMGIRRYLARWGEPLWGNTVFWNIADAVDRAVKHVNFEGQEFELVVDKHSGKAWCHEFEYAEEDY